MEEPSQGLFYYLELIIEKGEDFIDKRPSRAFGPPKGR